MHGPPEPPRPGLTARAGVVVTWPFKAMSRALRAKWLRGRAVRTPRNWWRLKPLINQVGLWLLALLYLAWIGRAFWVFIRDLVGKEGTPTWPWTINPDAASLTYSVSVVSNVLLTVGGGALVVVGWTIWRFRRVYRSYRRKAMSRAMDLVRAGTLLNEVVGRDQLCDVLMGDLRHRGGRRPHLIIGSIGTGKTALLVRLVERLTMKKAVPVVIQLRDVQNKEDLDFCKLAKKRFSEEIDDVIFRADEADRSWRRLRQTLDKIVVLADGLEEALKGDPDRDNVIREAIAKADGDRLPLVITSRPHDSLRAVKAALTYLEPLSEEAALEYVAGEGGDPTDRRRLDWVIEAANVAEAPIYLELARELESKGLLKHVTAGGDELSDPHDADEWALRTDLLDVWIDALIDGEIHEELPLTPETRAMVVENLSALACLGLREDNAIVSLRRTAEREHVEHRTRLGPSMPIPVEEVPSGDTAPHEKIAQVMRGRRRHIVSFDQGARFENEDMEALQMNERLAAAWGARMGLVENLGESVRFHHTVMQAFLGSRFMEAFVANGDGAAVLDRAYFDSALRNPGRELIMALIFYSRYHTLKCTCDGSGHRRCPIAAMSNDLKDAANDVLKRTKEDFEASTSPAGNASSPDISRYGDRVIALEMYAAALDIDSFDEWPRHRDIVEDIRKFWELVGQEPESEHELDAAKLALIGRMGESARLTARHQRWLRHSDLVTAYDLMFDIACRERARSVRYAIAREIGRGGDVAFNSLNGRLQPDFRTPTRQRSGAGRVGAEHTRVDQDRMPVGPPPWGERVYRKRKREENREARRREAFATRSEQECRSVEINGRVMSAWILPMLVLSAATTDHERTPHRTLAEWVDRAITDDGRPVCGGLPPQLAQLALAQGLKQAANDRPRSGQPDTARTFLRERTVELMRGTHFWFARLTLLQALTLWVMRDDRPRTQPMHGHGADPAEQVKDWLEQRTGPNRQVQREAERHPLVKAAGRLACKTLQTGRPDLFMWIDEADVVARIGSAPPPLDEPRFHNRWIAPSAGWSALDPRALQLLADVLIMTVLTQDRDDDPELEGRLRMADRYGKPYLPLCLTTDRAPLLPQRTVALEGTLHRGATCADGCPFELCPYPPKGRGCRVELSELFCSYQRGLLNAWQARAWFRLRVRRRGRWQRKVPVAGLRRFWDEMGQRARDQA